MVGVHALDVQFARQSEAGMIRTSPVFVAAEIDRDWNADYVSCHQYGNLFFLQRSPLAFILSDVGLKMAIHQPVIFLHFKQGQEVGVLTDILCSD